MKTSRLCTLFFLSSCSLAFGQLTPDRLYFGVDRPIPMQVRVPEGTKGEPQISLFAAGAVQPTASAPVVAGSVNLATLFGDLWKNKSNTVMFAQLVVGEARIGAPVVLQPLLDASPAIIDPKTGKPGFPPRRGMFSGYRAYVEKYVEMETTLGTLTIRLRPDQAPNTSWNFMQLADGGLYTEVNFHRIIGPQNGREGFMAQCGDPTGSGGGGPGYCIDLEDSKLPHDFGVLSMARTGDPNTNGSQFFLCFSREGTKFLDGAYCAFGQTISGADVIEKLEAVETQPSPSGEKSQPVKAPKVISAKLVDAAPYGESRPAVTRSAKESPAR